jgi:low affinity Fe/Cu permease
VTDKGAAARRNLRSELQVMRPVNRFERISQAVSEWSGRTETVLFAVLICVVWAITGPYFHYSDTWQLLINTLTNLVTFIMVFLIQRSQNKDTMAVQLKLNEIIAAVRGASNELIAIEDLSEDELRMLHGRYQRLLELTSASASTRASRSVEEAVHSDESAGASSTSTRSSASRP